MKKKILRFLIGLGICIFVVGISLNVYVYFWHNAIAAEIKQRKCDEYKELGVHELNFFYNQKGPIHTKAEADEFTNHANRAVQFFQLSKKCGGSEEEYQEALKFKLTADETRRTIKYSPSNLFDEFMNAKAKQ